MTMNPIFLSLFNIMKTATDSNPFGGIVVWKYLQDKPVDARICKQFVPQSTNRFRHIAVATFLHREEITDFNYISLLTRQMRPYGLFETKQSIGLLVSNHILVKIKGGVPPLYKVQDITPVRERRHISPPCSFRFRKYIT